MTRQTGSATPTWCTVDVYGLTAVAAGTQTVAATYSGGATNIGGACVTFTGVHQTQANAFTGAAVASGTSTTPSRAITSATGDMVFVGGVTQPSITWTVGSGETERWEFGGGGFTNAGYTEPGAASVTIAPTLSASNDWALAGFNVVQSTGGGNVSVTPSAPALLISTFAPSVLTPILVTAAPLALTLSTFAPIVTATNHQLVIPGPASLVLSTFAPVFAATAHQFVTPAPASLVLSSFAPTVTASGAQTITPTPAALTLSTFPPTVSISGNQSVTPGTASLVITLLAPTVTATNHQLLTPSPAALTLSFFAPTVATPRLVTPGLAALTLSGFAPTVTVPAGQLLTPPPAALTITTFAPHVFAGMELREVVFVSLHVSPIASVALQVGSTTTRELHV